MNGQVHEHFSKLSQWSHLDPGKGVYLMSTPRFPMWNQCRGAVSYREYQQVRIKKVK